MAYINPFRIAAAMLLASNLISFIYGCQYLPNKSNSVLIVSIKTDKDTNEKEEKLRFNNEAIAKAIQKGGQISISTDQINDIFPDWQSYGAMSIDNRHYVHGTFINFVASKGWKFHSQVFGNLTFVKEQWIKQD